LVAKILVADDNSNIQKMVGLALKDQGIDVVAVGNGEAAVRKISDVRPDLVLADVFMPVRNGYEVCQFVKGDSALAHIPVILLVGAFDPLDEQEAQRVGADGVLKKPFVPPDPLISMVKSALTRAGVSIGGAPVPAPVKEEPLRAMDMLTPRTQVTPPSSISLPALEDFPAADAEPVMDEVAAKPEPVRIDAGSQPLAFGSLLETPATEQEDDLAYATTTPRPELERDFKGGHEEEEEIEEEQNDKSGSWRRDGGDEAIAAAETNGGSGADWRETAFSEAPARKPSGGWTPQTEVAGGFGEAAETEQTVWAAVKEAPVEETKMAPEPIGFVAPSMAIPSFPETSIPVPSYAEPEPSVTAPGYSEPSVAEGSATHIPEAPFAQDAWAAALEPAKTPEAIADEPSAYQSEALEVESSSSTAAKGSVAEMPAPAEPAQPAGDAWYSAVSSPWDAEAKKASQLAAAWDAPAEKKAPEVARPAEPAPVWAAKEDTSATVDTLPASLSEDVRAEVEEAELPAATVEAIQQVTDTVIFEKPVDIAPAVVAEPAAAKSAMPSMEELVAKVLSQMSPEVLQAVTREILKPVVEAMVRDELNGKK
jgi:CheY-like chemotaxis protein